MSRVRGFVKPAPQQTLLRESLGRTREDLDSRLTVMKDEIEAGVRWWCAQLSSDMSEADKDSFQMHFNDVLIELYTGHWYTEDAQKGSGYRSILQDMTMDTKITEAARRAGINGMKAKVPEDVCMWINPGEVKVEHLQLNGGPALVFCTAFKQSDDKRKMEEELAANAATSPSVSESRIAGSF